MSNLESIIQQLEEERSIIDNAIRVLRGVKNPTKTSARASQPTTKRKKMSAAGRKRIAEAQKKRWAAIKKK